MTNGVAPLANAKIDENRRSVDTNENRERERKKWEKMLIYFCSLITVQVLSTFHRNWIENKKPAGQEKKKRLLDICWKKLIKVEVQNSKCKWPAGHITFSQDNTHLWINTDINVVKKWKICKRCFEPKKKNLLKVIWIVNKREEKNRPKYVLASQYFDRYFH